MRGIDRLLHEHPFFVGLDDETLTLMAGCAANRHVAADEYLFQEGDPALERSSSSDAAGSRVEAHRPAGPASVVETVEEGEVLGWRGSSPLTAGSSTPARSIPTGLVVFDGECLRAKCDEDRSLGYDLTAACRPGAARADCKPRVCACWTCTGPPVPSRADTVSPPSSTGADPMATRRFVVRAAGRTRSIPRL